MKTRPESVAPTRRRGHRRLLDLLLCFVSGLLFLAATGCDEKTDARTESVRLPSGATLENQTWYDNSGRSGWRHNRLSFKEPVHGAAEVIGELNYENRNSLFTRFPHPEEFMRDGERALLVGSFVCKRWTVKNQPSWYVASFEEAGRSSEGFAYFQSLLNTNEMPRPADISSFDPRMTVQAFVCDQLDLEHNVLVLKATGPYEPDPKRFPACLVYSAPRYDSVWKFDLPRTQARNGPAWRRPMPFRMALDFSVVISAMPQVMPSEDDRAGALGRSAAKEAASTSLELSDTELRHVECRYVLTNNVVIVDAVEAMYGFACRQPSRFFIVWQPHDPAAWQTASFLDLNTWKQVGASGFEGGLCREQFIRLRRVEP